MNTWSWLDNPDMRSHLLCLGETIPDEIPSFQAETQWMHSSIPFLLAVINGELVLRTRSGQRLSVDFLGGAMGYRARQNVRHELLVRALLGRRKGVLPTVLDATAGLGRDACLMAVLGCQVTCWERHRAVYLILKDGLERARRQLSELHHLTLYFGDVALQQGISSFDVVYLDPMFPVREKSANVKKEMNLFHELVGTDQDVCELFQAVLPLARQKIIIKRPLHAAPVFSTAPTYTIKGKSSRFDVFQVGSGDA
jgi:16S rRNA (guanine1516-N2)-methyltransferase